MRKEGGEVHIFLYFAWLPRTSVHLLLKIVSEVTDHNFVYQHEWKSSCELWTGMFWWEETTEFHSAPEYFPATLACKVHT